MLDHHFWYEIFRNCVNFYILAILNEIYPTFVFSTAVWLGSTSTILTLNYTYLHFFQAMKKITSILEKNRVIGPSDFSDYKNKKPHCTRRTESLELVGRLSCLNHCSVHMKSFEKKITLNIPRKIFFKQEERNQVGNVLPVCWSHYPQRLNCHNLFL